MIYNKELNLAPYLLYHYQQQLPSLSKSEISNYLTTRLQ